MSRTEIALRLGVDQGRVRRLLARESPHLSEPVVERAGIALEGDPRLAARLYPELDW